MKLKHTQAKKARRASAFHKAGNSTAQSEKRLALRYGLQKPRLKTFGLMVKRFQRVIFKKDQFDQPVYKTIPHADI